MADVVDKARGRAEEKPFVFLKEIAELDCLP